MKTRILETNEIAEEKFYESSLRPQCLKDYIGQEQLKSTLSVYLDSAKKRKEALDHVLLYGPPGLGKTTLANIIANEMGSKIRVTTGPAIEHPGDLAAILNGLHENDVLFIDEIHRLNRQIEEVLYPAMEDFAMDVMTGKGPSATSVRFHLPRFTLIGATTRAGLLTAPLRDRFGIIHRLEFYSAEELETIIRNSAKKLNVPIEKDAASELAKRSRGTPRIANRFLKRIRDFAVIENDGKIDLAITKKALEFLKVDESGLDSGDLRILETIIKKFDGGPVGIDTIAAALSEDISTIEDVYEPYLIQRGFLMRTPKGRMVTKEAYRHLGVTYDKD